MLDASPGALVLLLDGRHLRVGQVHRERGPATCRDLQQCLPGALQVRRNEGAVHGNAVDGEALGSDEHAECDAFAGGHRGVKLRVRARIQLALQRRRQQPQERVFARAASRPVPWRSSLAPASAARLTAPCGPENSSR